MSPTLFGCDNTPVTSGATGRDSLAKPTEKNGCALLSLQTWIILMGHVKMKTTLWAPTMQLRYPFLCLLVSSEKTIVHTMNTNQYSDVANTK